VPKFTRLEVPEKLHDRVTRALALEVLEAERDSRELVFPNEADLCLQLGVSRSILREAVKVLADKGMVEVRQRVGTRAKPRSSWNQLDPDILDWWAELGANPRLFRELCDVRLAIEPTVASLAAVRGSEKEIDAIERCLIEREAKLNDANQAIAVKLEVDFHAAVLAACHSPLMQHLSRVIRRNLGTLLSFTTGQHTAEVLETVLHRQLYEAIRAHDSKNARAVAEKMVAMAMQTVEQACKQAKTTRKRATDSGTRPAKLQISRSKKVR
jgi:DNA-binding FadR family transcriptional regulator